MQRLLVVDEAEVRRLADEALGLAGVHAGLALLRHQQPERAEGRPGPGRRGVGRPAKGCGVGQGHKQRPRNPAAPGGRLSGVVGGDEGRLWGAEVLEVGDAGLLVCALTWRCRRIMDIFMIS